MQRLRLNVPASVVADYFHLFANRRAYTLQSSRPRPESSRHYYYRPKDKKTGQGLSLTLDTIRRHLEGDITIGLYSINPAIQCSKWVAIDADYEDALSDLLKLSFYLRLTNGSGQPLITFGWLRKPGAAFTSPATFTVCVTRSKAPSS